ncbi:MAG TPA: Fe-S cluster assembly protein SufD [Steroidobacteraceae bacterium]|nr:Fe-S cluster assembly protein SufD [Steroidobacteraceae bacterium]
MSAALRAEADRPQSAAMRSFEAQWHARSQDPLHESREHAMDRFLRLGLPSSRDDSWGYTNLRPLSARSFTEIPALISVSSLGAPAQNAGDASIEGVYISSLRQLARDNPGVIAAHLMQSADADLQRWALLNAALFADGLYIKIGARLKAPLLLVHSSPAAQADGISYPRLIIEAAPGSCASIIERHEGAAGLRNSVTQITLAAAAEIEHYRVFAAGADMSHVDTLEIRQHRASRCKQFTVIEGGGLVRTNLTAQLQHPDAKFDGYALLVGYGARHADCTNIVRHEAANTHSTQTARAIAGGDSRVIFNSKVVVDSGAPHSQSQQSSRGLLLSPTAEIDSRPQLEIHTDEVKCAHGATTGRLDPNMLFYLLSRGIDRDTAQSLLVYAFLADVLTGMSSAETRAAVESALIAQLPHEEVLREFR